MCFKRYDFDFSRGITAFFCNALCCVPLMILVTLLGAFATQTNFTCSVQFVKDDSLQMPVDKVRPVNTCGFIECSCCCCASRRCECKHSKNK